MPCHLTCRFENCITVSRCFVVVVVLQAGEGEVNVLGFAPDEIPEPLETQTEVRDAFRAN